ncbi:MAG: hypothetical protein FJZ47_02300 [Candidatus Tectomicrobia bacterium]|uniref:Uncharacterized protein n=1 Tax=Tectimicrobiota bacterium TaxID=2528274 RepID=A0A937VZA1_UNCTE|nr:hypothetical protein [Candidatus Tectomicrobia bacterium]
MSVPSASLREMVIRRAGNRCEYCQLPAQFQVGGFVVRRQLAAEGSTLAGLYAGHAKRETAQPTAERLLEAFQEVTLTVVKGVQQVYRHLTALSPLQERILELLGFSSRVYTRLCTVSHEPL